MIEVPVEADTQAEEADAYLVSYDRAVNLIAHIDYHELENMTIAILTLHSGYKVTGEACRNQAHPSWNSPMPDPQATLGRQLAVDCAIGKLIALDAYHQYQVRAEREGRGRPRVTHPPAHPQAKRSTRLC